jgi:hypothetical protein
MRSDTSHGIVADLVGGVVFGIMMQMMDARRRANAHDDNGRQGSAL